jgi:hypothetical protein
MRAIFKIARLLVRFVRWNCYVWLPDYLRKSLAQGKQPRLGTEITDVVFLVVDHFEPSRREGERGVHRVREWCEAFATMAGRHRDSDGVPPQHSWFYRYDYPNDECVRILSEFVYRGFGEIDFHLHHGNDTEQTFSKTIRDGVEWFNEFGAMLTAEETPTKHFAYIAGNWALDNGRRDASMSGVNTELSILGSAGCYADFTFPAFSVTSQPSMVNSIYYATDTPEPKSYDTGNPVCVGGAASGDLLIFQGPICIDWSQGDIEYAALESFAPYFRRRIDLWIRAGVSVVGRPEWLFVKLHTHGMQSRDMFLGEQMDSLHKDLEDLCKDSGCRLHYVTAREAYNIAKAAEAGRQGDAGKYRDYEIGKPVNRLFFSNARALVTTYSPERVTVEVTTPRSDTRMLFSEHPLHYVEGGKVTGLDLVCSQGIVRELTISGEGNSRVRLKSGVGSAEIDVTLPYTYRLPAERVLHG